jgi:hypothetical protein
VVLERRYDSIMSLIAACNTIYALTDVYCNDMKTPMGLADLDTLLLDIDCMMIATILVHGSSIHRYLLLACYHYGIL